VTVGDRIERVIVLVAPPPDGLATVSVNGAAPINIDGDSQVTYDTEP
jgi:hypothetical protein